MKLVLAYVQPFKVEELSMHLGRLPGFPGMTIAAVRGFGRERAELPSDVIEKELDEFSDKILVQIVADDDRVDELVAGIARTACTGQAGDGLVLVLPVERAVRIRDSADPGAA